MQTPSLLAFVQAPQPDPDASRTNGGSMVAVWIAVAVALFAGQQRYRRSRLRKGSLPDQDKG